MPLSHAQRCAEGGPAAARPSSLSSSTPSLNGWRPVPHGSARTTQPTTRLQQQSTARRRTLVRALDPSSTQEVIIGGAIVSSIAAALFLGFQKEKEVCTSCNGSGGVICFACEGSGIMESVSPEVEREMRQANLGRNVNRLECRACKGVGRLLCKKCGGSGYC